LRRNKGKEEEEVEHMGEIGKGNFRTVYWKKIRSSPVVGKSFKASASA